MALVDRQAEAQKAPAYLKLNPNGLIPVLVDTRGGSELVLYETGAILMHLADTHIAARLCPALGSAERGHYYKWMVWLTNTLQATLIHCFYPERMVASHGQPWLLGANFTKRPAHHFASIAAYLQRMLTRPAVQAAMAAEGLQAPHG